MYSDHTYLSGVTKMLSDHFKNVAEEADELFCKNKENKSALDIGSNDGTQLKHFQKLGYEVLGVEASKTTAKIANEAGVPTLNDFFNLEVVKKLNKKFDRKIKFNLRSSLFYKEYRKYRILKTDLREPRLLSYSKY